MSLDDPTLHPRHPGRGCSTSLICAEGDEAEVGGFFVFFPSGATKQMAWRQVQPIQPTLEAAKTFTGKLIESLQSAGQWDDLNATNWVSVCAAVQRIILDWNDSLQRRINVEMVRQLGEPDRPKLPPARQRMH
jgi:hypothetical protein